MSAQQQLAKLIPQTEEGSALPLDNVCAFVDFLRDHGPAIAELIEACVEFCDDANVTSHARIDSAVRRLTEPKA